MPSTSSAAAPTKSSTGSVVVTGTPSTRAPARPAEAPSKGNGTPVAATPAAPGAARSVAPAAKAEAKPPMPPRPDARRPVPLPPRPSAINTIIADADDLLLEDDDAPSRPLDPGTIAVPSPDARGDQLHDAYADDARLAIASYEQQLATVTDIPRRGRLHYEVARLYEGVLRQLEQAERNYDQALAAMPEYLPAIVGARRVALARAQWPKAIDLYDREIRFTADRPGKAGLLLAKGRILEDRIGDHERARAAYASAADLSDPEPAIFKALERVDMRSQAWESLDHVLAGEANAFVGDVRLRAATICRRARLREVHGGDLEGAVELYALAFSLDPKAPGASAALKRLYAVKGRHRDLVAVLQREADLAEDPAMRALALFRVGQILLERLGDRDAGRAALEQAAALRPVQPVVLEALARVYDDLGDATGLARTLAELAECTSEPHEKLGHLHRIGTLCVESLDDREGAIRAFEAALAIDAAHIPTLRALAPLYAADNKHAALVAMYEGEAAAATESARRAAAHARAAAILERTDRVVEAIAHLEHALALEPELLTSFEALVRLYALTGRHHELVELYERHLERVDLDRRIESLFAIGDIYKGPLADPEQAEHAYRRILRLRAQHLGAVHALQRVAEQSSRWRPLVDALELEVQIVTAPAQLADLLHRIAEILDERLGRRDEAISRLRAVLAVEPRHAATLATLGRIYQDEGRWADLAEIYERELEVTPDGPQAALLLHKLGELYARQLAQPDKALACFRRALQIDPHHGPSIITLSAMLRARSAWRELVGLAELERDGYRDPHTRALACFHLGQLYEEHLDDREHAEACYAQALELRPGYRPAADALARVRGELGHWQELASELERDAAGLAETQLAIGALLRAGEIARDHLGATDRAIACFERVLDRDPQHLGALLALESLYRQAGAQVKLADVLARQAAASSDPVARAMMLRERVRVLELAGTGTVEDRVEAWTGVLAAHPNDRGALGGLELEALASGDPRVIASVDARLAASVSDPALRAAYLTRRAEALEAAGGPQALDVYREALALDPESLAALRGMSRLADVLGDGEALVEAAEREAQIAKSPRDAAEALVRAGSVRSERAGDREGAITAFDSALQHWPDHEVAAERLSTLMRAQRQYARLAERLLRAAGEARDPARQRALWLEVAGLYARELQNLGAAIAALTKLLEGQPHDAAALLELARLLHADRRTDDAIALLRRCIVVAEDDELAEAHLALANALHERGEHADAFRSYEQALKLRPNDARVLERVVELQLATGLFGAAVDTAARLRSAATDPAAIVAADIRLARAHLGMKKVDEAIDAFADAIMVEGPGGEASSELHALATRPEHWKRYVAALRHSIGMIDGEPRPSLYLELARVLYERLGDDANAEAALVEGLRECNGDAGIRYELANVMRRGLRYTEAVEQLQAVLMDDVVRVEAWRGLAQTFDELGHARARSLVHAALAVFEVATQAEREDLRTWQPRTDVIKPGALVGDTTSDLHVARDQQAPGTALLASIVEGLAKIRPPDLARWGVSSKDRLPQRPDLPMRALVDRVASIFGIDEYDVYTHPQRDRAVFVENTAKPSILVPNWLGELPPPAQTFLVAQALVDLARGLHTIELFTVRELEILLAAAARAYVPGHGERVAAADVLDDHQRTIVKAVSRRRRRAHEISAAAYASQRGPDTPTLVQWVRQSARRIALVVADDLPTCVGVVTQGENLLGKVGIAAVRSSPIVADLVRVWVSRPAFALRHAIGLLPPGPGG